MPWKNFASESSSVEHMPGQIIKSINPYSGNTSFLLKVHRTPLHLSSPASSPLPFTRPSLVGTRPLRGGNCHAETLQVSL